MKGLVIALQFLTRIPLNLNLQISHKEFGASSKYFPVVGVVIGIILAFTYELIQTFFPPLVVGAVILVFEIILTGGIHLDGYMDTADGLLSARPREQIFKIMKDSRVGAHSVTALVSLLIIKFSLIVSLPQHLAARFFLLMPVVGRWMMVFCIAYFPYAKEDGLGKVFWQETSKIYWYAATIFLIIFTTYILSLKYILVVIITFLLALTPTLIINKKLNGQTGDTYGAINEVTQVIFLFICLLIYQI